MIKQLIKLCLAVILGTCAAQASTYYNGVQYDWGAVTPGTCSPPAFFINTSTNPASGYQCTIVPPDIGRFIAVGASAAVGGSNVYCAPASASATAYTCSGTQGGTTAPSALTGLSLLFTPDVPNTGAFTIAVGSLTATSALTANGATPAAGYVTTGNYYSAQYNGTAFIVSLASPGTSTNSTANQLRKFRLALAKTRDGASDTKVLAIGDSTTLGKGSTDNLSTPTYNSWVARLKLTNDKNVPTVGGLAVASCCTGILFDNRWTFGTGWSPGGGTLLQITGVVSAAGTLTFTPGATQGTYDSFRVFYYAGSNTGTFTATATGGTPLVINSTSGANNITSQVVTAASAGTGNSVVFSSVTSQEALIIGVEPFLSTTPSIIVGNGGMSGIATSGWAYTGGAGQIQLIKAEAPDLCFIFLGINDAQLSTATATVLSNLQVIINACQVTGDVILMTPWPSQSPPTSTFEALYQPAFIGLGQQLGIPVLDIYGRQGGTWQTLYSFDSLHPNEYGYWDIGTAVSNFVTQLVGNSND